MTSNLTSLAFGLLNRPQILNSWLNVIVKGFEAGGEGNTLHSLSRRALRVDHVWVTVQVTRDPS